VDLAFLVTFFFAVPINLAFGTLDHKACCLFEDLPPLEPPMSKRKPAKSSKRARSPAITTRAHGKKQTIVKSARDNLLRSVAAWPIESPLELDDPKEEAPNVEKQEAPIAAKQVGRSQMRGFYFASATENMVAYQAKLLEMAQANMRFALDYSQKLTTIRSPFQFVDVIVEFTKRRADMLEKQSTEMAALTRR
jgi:hypothetical protein